MSMRINAPVSTSKDDKSAGKISHLPTLMKKLNTGFLEADAPPNIPHHCNLKKTLLLRFLHLHTDDLQNVNVKTDYFLQHFVKM